MYCVRDKCKFYREATINLPQYEKMYRDMIDELSRINALNSKPTIIVQDFTAVPIESKVMLSEGEIWEARMYQDVARQHGVPDWQIPRYKNVSFMIENAKQKCLSELMDSAKQFVSIVVDEESYYPGIVVYGKMLVGKPKNTKNYGKDRH